jgi:hypothetical protein
MSRLLVVAAVAANVWGSLNGVALASSAPVLDGRRAESLHVARTDAQVPPSSKSTPPAPAATPAPAAERMTLAAGQTAIERRGVVVGRDDRSYVVRLAKGQTLNVELATPSTSLYFNVLPSGSEDALYASDRADTGNKASVVVPADGEYRVLVYLFRHAARRGAKAPFTLRLSVK